MNRECGIAALTVAVAMSFGTSAMGQTPDLSRAFSGETAAIAKPAAALQKKMKAEKSGFAASGTGKTHFEKLKGLYAQEPRLNANEAWEPFFMGRCYYKGSPDIPRPAFFILNSGIAPNMGEDRSQPYLKGVNYKVRIWTAEGPLEPWQDALPDGNYRARLRWSGAYPLAEISRLKTDNVYRAGDIAAECYFSKKVHD